MSPDHFIQPKSRALDDGGLSPLLTAEAAIAAYTAASQSINLPSDEMAETGLKYTIGDYNLIVDRMRTLLGFVKTHMPIRPDRLCAVSEVLTKMERVREELRRDENCPQNHRVMWGRMTQAVTASLQESGYDVTTEATREF